MESVMSQQQIKKVPFRITKIKYMLTLRKKFHCVLV